MYNHVSLTGAKTQICVWRNRSLLWRQRDDKGTSRRRERGEDAGDWLVGGIAGRSIRGCRAAGEARGGVGDGRDGRHAPQGGGQDVGHHGGAHATLLPLGERAGLGHTNGMKHHRGNLNTGRAATDKTGVATDRLNIPGPALISRALCFEWEAFDRKARGPIAGVGPLRRQIELAAGNAPRLWLRNASPLSPGGLENKSPDGCAAASAAPSSSPRGYESHPPTEGSRGRDGRLSMTHVQLWGQCQWQWRRKGVYLQGDELLKDLDLLVILWVLLDVGVYEECLKRMQIGQLLKQTHSNIAASHWGSRMNTNVSLETGLRPDASERKHDLHILQLSWFIGY